MSAVVVSGRPRNRAPSDIEGMLWFRTRQACRVRPSEGRRELESGGAERGRIRRPGAGRPGIKQSRPGFGQVLEKLVDPVTRDGPQSPLRWT